MHLEIVILNWNCCSEISRCQFHRETELKEFCTFSWGKNKLMSIVTTRFWHLQQSCSPGWSQTFIELSLKPSYIYFTFSHPQPFSVNVSTRKRTFWNRSATSSSSTTHCCDMMANNKIESLKVYMLLSFRQLWLTFWQWCCEHWEKENYVFLKYHEILINFFLIQKVFFCFSSTTSMKHLGKLLITEKVLVEDEKKR